MMRRSGISWSLVAALLILASAAPAAAATTAPTDENTLIRRSSDAAGRLDPAGSNDSRGLSHVAWMLALVIALILLLRWLGRRLFAAPAPAGEASAISLLSRVVLAPKQQVLVLRVGRRIVVVGDTGQQMTPLCEISDPEEAAALVAQMQTPRGEPASFRQFFRRAIQRYDGGVEPSDAGEDRDAEAEASRGNPTLSTAQQEISGLAEKARLLARQFR